MCFFCPHLTVDLLMFYTVTPYVLAKDCHPGYTSNLLPDIRSIQLGM